MTGCLGLETRGGTGTQEVRVDGRKRESGRRDEDHGDGEGKVMMIIGEGFGTKVTWGDAVEVAGGLMSPNTTWAPIAGEP